MSDTPAVAYAEARTPSNSPDSAGAVSNTTVRNSLFEETHEILRPRRATGLGLSAVLHAGGSIALMFQPLGAVPAVLRPDSRLVAVIEMPLPEEVLIEDDPVEPGELAAWTCPASPSTFPRSLRERSRCSRF